MTIAITGGGTGGHLAIANALKEELNSRGLKPIYIGSTTGQDENWFKNDTGFEKAYFLNSRGVVNKKGLKKLFVLKDILKSSLTCKDIFKIHKVKAVFCVGGYSAAPAAFASIYTRTPLYIHEQNAVIGTLNKILKPFAKEFFSSYDINSKVKEYPVSDKFFESRKIREELKTIIFLGGSQGASFINDLATKIVPKLIKNNIQVIHQTGKNDYEKIKNFYEKNSLDVDCFAFSKSLIDKLSNADFAVSRAGASTLWELSANALPTLFIPYPYAAKNHQYFNAQELVSKKAALLKTQNELDEEMLWDILEKLTISDISENLSNIITKNGIQKIADIILKG
ncbi:undecaprenyldiphospho-muramoylpentapeptide beta-N-acetylglucosaminyltransferase [Sulfurospirillum arcachonense]|uniref:undecaprenyldiphospho-muramoylpentapeptide beta-N-acetylglucosaminyltransferase n=1 Tax=Sulfurospirillum arcachonense TaxID=57666 RepID=UPI00046A90BD|nr:undecaprenyldiphospho-muramoylpentapeptide beta-N-acetylglucosaminyltransferase [Sulfurospirillum arcachonense]